MARKRTRSIPASFKGKNTTNKGFKAPKAVAFGNRVYLSSLRPNARTSRERPAGYKTKAAAAKAAAAIRKTQGSLARVFKVGPGKYAIYSWSKDFRKSLGGSSGTKTKSRRSAKKRC